jgi:hypothetical protein
VNGSRGGDHRVDGGQSLRRCAAQTDGMAYHLIIDSEHSVEQRPNLEGCDSQKHHYQCEHVRDRGSSA